MNELKTVYEKIKANYVDTKDGFYDTENKDTHLIIFAECLAYADCMMILADEIIREVEQLTTSTVKE